MKISIKDQYCYSRAAELQETSGKTWKQSYTQACEEWKRSRSTTPPDYDDDTSDLEEYIE